MMSFSFAYIPFFSVKSHVLIVLQIIPGYFQGFAIVSIFLCDTSVVSIRSFLVQGRISAVLRCDLHNLT